MQIENQKLLLVKDGVDVEEANKLLVDGYFYDHNVGNIPNGSLLLFTKFTPVTKEDVEEVLAEEVVAPVKKTRKPRKKKVDNDYETLPTSPETVN